MSTHMLSCLTWIPKGAPKEQPIPFELEPEVLAGLQSGMNENMNITDAMDDEGLGSDLEDTGKDDDDVLKALDMDNYDNDGPELGQFLGQNLAEIPTAEDYHDDEDEEDQRIRPTDSCIIVGNTTEDDSIIEIYLYDESTNNLYVHHDFKLPSFPLSVAWMQTDPKSKSSTELNLGSYVAVSTFNPGIEIWNCDIMHPIEPVCILGGFDNESAVEPVVSNLSSSKKKKKGKVASKKKQPAPKFKPGSHTDAVMSVSWNQHIKHLLASGSADTTVKLWDVTTQECTNTFTHHSDKVQSVEWNPTEHYILLTGSYDRTVQMLDIRTPQNTLKFNVSADIETVKWNPSEPYLFVAATEDGNVACYDARTQKNLWTIQAHTKPTTCIAMNARIPSLFATGSIDETVKIWNIVDNQPKCITSRNLDVGKLFTMQFDVSSPFILASGGDGGALAIWDIMENYQVNETFKRVAEELQLGDQTLPEEYIEMQKQGIQAKGLGPGREGARIRNVDDDDYDSQDEDDYDYDEEGEMGGNVRMTMSQYAPRGEDEEEEEEEEFADEDDDDEMME